MARGSGQARGSASRRAGGVRPWHVAIVMILAAIAALALLASQKGFEHSLAGLPHWSTACPQGASAVLVIGQSQASNTGPKRHISLSGSRAFADGKCYYLRDPMPGTGGRGGTIWPGFADRLGRRVLIADIAISGSAIEEWTVPAQLAKVRRTLDDLRRAGYPDPLIIWMQGETNGARRTTAAAYHAQLRTLLQQAPDRRWLITRESICYGMQDKWRPLDEARDRIARAFPNVTLGPDLDNLGLAMRQEDRCHLTVEGQARLASGLADAARPLLAR